MHKGIVICGHGTKNQEGLDAFLEVFAKLEQQISKDFFINYGFIEYAKPLLKSAILDQIQIDITEIIVLPVLIFSGVHTSTDIPNTIKEIQNKNPNVNFKLAETIDLNEKLIQLCKEHIQQKLNELTGDVENKNLLVIGVGSSKPEANIKIATLTRTLWEKLAFLNASYSFISKTTYPSVDSELERLLKIAEDDIIVLPIILFPGMYLTSINKKLLAFKTKFDKEVVVCDPLFKSKLLIDCLLYRLQEVEIKTKESIIIL